MDSLVQYGDSSGEEEEEVEEDEDEDEEEKEALSSGGEGDDSEMTEEELEKRALEEILAAKIRVEEELAVPRLGTDLAQVEGGDSEGACTLCHVKPGKYRCPCCSAW